MGNGRVIHTLREIDVDSYSEGNSRKALTTVFRHEQRRIQRKATDDLKQRELLRDSSTLSDRSRDEVREDERSTTITRERKKRVYIEAYGKRVGDMYHICMYG